VPLTYLCVRTDGDGYTTAQEHANGYSDPTNALSTPANPGPLGEPLPAADGLALAALFAAVGCVGLWKRK
jgi:hypothetical protein